MRRQPHKTRLKTALRKFSDAVKAGNRDEAVKMIPMVYKAIDMAAKKHIIHPNNASRKKSLVARMVATKK